MLNNLSNNLFELNFYQDKNKRKYNLIPIEISKNDSETVNDVIIYNNHYALVKKVNVILGDHNRSFVCRWCLSSYTNENMLKKHKEKCQNKALTTIKTSTDSHVYWKKHFHKNPFYFRMYTDFEANSEKDNSSIGNRTTNIYNLNPVLNSYRIISELDDVLKSGFHKSPLGCPNVDWFVNEVIKLEKKMAFYFKKN